MSLLAAVGPARMLWLLLLVLSPMASISTREQCAQHTTRGACLIFRLQHTCAWDKPSGKCVEAVPCEDRSQASCETELTTGDPWDATTNKCFFDAVQLKCRFADECYGLSVPDCGAAGCAVSKVCTPADMRRLPGPNVCKSVCTLPRWPGAAPPPSNGTRAHGAPAQTAGLARAGPTRRARPAAAPAIGPTVQTSSGAVRGTASPYGVQSFLGVPFAEAPVDELRWAPPQPIWWEGTFEATSTGASCEQALGYYAVNAEKCQGYTRGDGGCAGYSEDCLNMNVYTPAADGGSRAVMVWIHGGCFVSGSAAEYDGAPLAAAQDVVVFVVQYRLGAFGFLGGDALRSRDPSGSTGNWGLLDNIASLQWIQKNAAAFGGDPSRVTIFGESSGAGSVSQLLGVKPAWPYFHRAIMESGTASFWTYIPLDAAERSYARVVESAGCSGARDEVACILAAGSGGVANAVSGVPCRDACTWAPTVDGVLVPGKTIDLARAGQLRPGTPVITGFNLHDGVMFVTGYPFSMYTMNAQSLSSYYSERFGEERRQELSALFPVPGTFPGSPSLSTYFYAAQRCETDFSYACTSLWLSAAHTRAPVWGYQFSTPTGAQGLSLHGSEIDYIFGTVQSPSPGQQVVSSAMMTYWANFAKDGDPNGNPAQRAAAARNSSAPPYWPAWDAKWGALINLTESPYVTSVTPQSFLGCPFFDGHWDFYSGCLPPQAQAQERWV